MLLPLLLCGSAGALRVPRRAALRNLAAAGVAPLVAAPPAGAAPAEVFAPPAASLRGRTIVITGANTGLGLESAARLAEAGADVVATARTAGKAAYAVDEVARRTGKTIRAVELDLGDLKSVSSFPARLPKDVTKVDVLMENAGVMAIPDKLSTRDGFERQIGVNHLGHFALTAAMMPLLEKAPTFRVIAVSSSANFGASKDAIGKAIADDLDPKEYSQWGNYCLSKAFNVLFADELQRRFEAKGLRGSAVSLHPGAVQTDLARYLISGTEKAEAGVALADTYATMNGFQQQLLKGLSNFVLPIPLGANTQVFLAASPNLAADGGLYFDSMKPAKPGPATGDADLAAKLWAASERLTKVKLAI